MSRQEELRFRRPDGGAEALWERFRATGSRGALVGPEGTGKSTLLLELCERLREQGLDVVHQQVFSEVPRLEDRVWEALVLPRVAIAIDSFDLLPATERLRFRFHARDRSPLLVAAHRSTWLPTLHQHEVSDALLGDLLTELVGPVEAERIHPHATSLLRAHRGNARAVLRALYDEWAAGTGAYAGSSSGASAR